MGEAKRRRQAAPDTYGKPESGRTRQKITYIENLQNIVESERLVGLKRVVKRHIESGWIAPPVWDHGSVQQVSYIFDRDADPFVVVVMRGDENWMEVATAAAREKGIAKYRGIVCATRRKDSPPNTWTLSSAEELTVALGHDIPKTS